MSEPTPQIPPDPDEEIVEEQAARRPSGLKVAFRVAVGGAVIGFLVARGDLGRIAEVMSGARPWFIVAGVGAILAGLAVSAVRWQAYLEPLGIRLPASTLFRLYFIGVFFNAFLPTGIGGDAYKAVRLRRGPGSLATALASVFLDRYAGVIGLGLIGITGAAILAADGEVNSVVVLSALLSMGILLAAAVMAIYGERLLIPPLRGRVIGDKIQRMLRAFEVGARNARAARRGIAAGVVFQGLVLGYHLAIARALRIDVPVAGMIGVAVIASLATMIPLTINGLGFREGAYIWALGRYGVEHDVALAFALLILGVLLAASVVGGLVYIIAGGEVSPPDLDEERAVG